MADVSPLQPAAGLAPPSLLLDLALESLDLAPQVSNDAGVLGDVVGDAEQVLLDLREHRRARRYSLPRCWGLPEGSSFLFLPPGPSVNGGNRPLASTPTTCHTTRLCQTHTPKAASPAHQPSAALSLLAGWEMV